jgi:methylenetetrahydrofolate--tRNA-(uracil-5-)-methyltransferase
VAPAETSLGSLIAYITNPSRREFQPMNANYGLMPEAQPSLRGRQKKLAFGERALRSLDDWIRSNRIEDSAVSISASLQRSA